MSSHNLFLFYWVLSDDSSTAFMSITNKSLDTQKLQRLGIPPDLIGQIFELCNFLRTPPNEKPDFINWSILSGLCLFNNGSSHLPDVNETEKMTIERLQVSFLFGYIDVGDGCWRQIVTNIQKPSPTCTCHQHHCSPPILCNA